MTRRQFLGATGFLATMSSVPAAPVDAAPVDAASSDAASKGAVFCRLALKYHMIGVGKTPTDKLRVAARAGFDGVELSMRDLPHVNEIRRASDKIGIAIHGLTHGTDDLYEPALRMCKAIGGDAVLVIAREHADRSYEQNFAVAHAVVRRFLPLAKQLQIRLLIENVRASFLKEAEEMARFVDSFDSPMVGAYFDCGNAITWTQQSAEHWVRVLGDRIAKVDIKDRGHAQFGDIKLKRQGVVGTDGGEIHWQNVRRELANIHFTGWATAEVAGGDEKRLTAMVSWMRSVLGMLA